MSVKLKLESTNGDFDFTPWLDVEKGKGMEPGDPQFTEKIFARSLLKAGATLALEHLREKEMVFPLIVSVPGVATINKILNPSFAHDGNGATSALGWTTGNNFYVDLDASIKVFVLPGYSQASSIFGLESYCQVKTAGTTTLEGISTGEAVPVTSGVPITISFSLYEEVVGQKVKVSLGSSTVGSIQQEITQTNKGWTRHSITLTPTKTGNAIFAITSVGAASAINFIFTAVTTLEPYADGDTTGWKWLGKPGDSESENYHGKPGLAEMIQEANIVINTPGARVEWLDEGATKPTYFSLISGQFDDEFDYRLSEHNGLKGHLRLFCQPLGYDSQLGARALTLSGAATTVKVGTSPVVTFQAAAQLAGDGPALLQAQVKQQLGGVLAVKAYMACAVLPSASYLPYLSAASLGEGLGAKWLTDTLAPGGTYIHCVEEGTGNVQIAKWQPVALAKALYSGEQRILVAARVPAGIAAMPFQLLPIEESLGEITGVATPVATTAWTMYDMGVISSASANLAAGAKYGMLIQSIRSGVATRAVDIGAIFQFPESSTCFVNTIGKLPETSSEGEATFDGVANAIRMNANIGVPASGIAPQTFQIMYDVSRYARGAIPQIPAAKEPPTIAVLATNQGDMNTEMTLNINVLEQTRYVF